MSMSQSISHAPDDIGNVVEHPTAGYRTLPHNLDAERGLLGAILIDNRAVEKVSDFLRSHHFMAGQHSLIYEACEKLIERGQIADPITLKRYFEQNESLADIGGPAYLVELAGGAPTIVNAEAYGKIVYDLAIKRELISIGREMVDNAYEADVDEAADKQIEQAEESLYKLAETGSYDRGFVPFREAVKSAIDMAAIAHKREGALAGVTTGFVDVDKLLGGLHKSDLLILAGRPAMGKTSLATNIAYNAARAWVDSEGGEGAVVGFFSLEMSGEQLASRIISEQTEISSDKMRKGEVPNEVFPRLVAASQELHRMPIFIDDTPALTVGALRTRARRLKRTHDLGLIVIDYLQLLQGSGNRSDGRVQEVSEITRGLKTLAKELNVPVLALSQLSRQVENRDDKRPHLADLRESGSIEQDADVVMFIYREEYYLEKAEPQQRVDEDGSKYTQRLASWEDRMAKARNLADVIVAKQRHGPVGTVTLQFTGEFTRFSDLDPHHGGY
ncbi:MAG: replicative DNA helicase [Rhodospirillales bacterium]